MSHLLKSSWNLRTDITCSCPDLCIHWCTVRAWTQGLTGTGTHTDTDKDTHSQFISPKYFWLRKGGGGRGVSVN